MYAYAYWSDYSGKKSSITPEVLLQKQKVDLLNQAKKRGRSYQSKDKQEIEQALNFFLPNRNGPQSLSINTSFTADEITQMENAIREKIEAAISKYGISGVDWGTLTAMSEGGAATAAGGKIDKGGLRWELGNASEWNSFESIQQRLSIISKGIRELPINNQGNLRERLLSLLSQWRDLKKTANITEKNYFGKLGPAIQTGKGSSFISELNSLMKEFKQKTASYVTGEIGEMWAAASANLYKQITEQGFADVEAALQFIGNNSMSGLTGKDRETHFIDSKKNLSSLSYGVNSKGETITFSGAQGNAKQGKVDFKLTLPDSQKTTYDLSIKNYSDKAEHFTIHSGSSIIFLLQQYGDLLDYFINTVPRNGMPTKGNPWKNKIKDGPSSDFGDVEKILKVSLLAQGLMGSYTTGQGTTTENVADTFVIFKNGKYNVYFISDIIQKIVNNIDNLESYGVITNIDNSSGLSFANLENVWISKQDENGNEIPDRSYGLQRTAALLVRLHEIKLEMSITLNALP